MSRSIDDHGVDDEYDDNQQIESYTLPRHPSKGQADVAPSWDRSRLLALLSICTMSIGSHL